MGTSYIIPTLPLHYDLETKEILKQANNANKALAELKGVAKTIPNEEILISSLTLQEAKESSEIENIVTTHDDLFAADGDELRMTPASKEVLKYRSANRKGYQLVLKDGLLTSNMLKEIQKELVGNQAGFRTQTGTVLKDGRGQLIYSPPQNSADIEKYMSNLEQYINGDIAHDVDPLIKMAIIHHQFESIHPFYDGNGRTGRILNVLYLVRNGLLDLPILYLSRYITKNKQQYYKLIQDIRDKNGANEREWQAWILFILKGVEQSARDTVQLVSEMDRIMQYYKEQLRPLFGKSYKHELINNLFFHPYTKRAFLAQEMGISKKTATKYLDMMVDKELLIRIKMGRENYYINTSLVELLTSKDDINTEQ